MPDDSSLHEKLPDNLQAAVDKRLTVGEVVLMTLSGAHGEGLAATDRRIILVREQMPILGAEAEVDTFDYPYDQIATVRVEDAVGGGHLKLIPVTPPIDEKEVTIFFPAYALNPFDAAATRIRMLVEQTRSVPIVPILPTNGPETRTPVCPSCGLVGEEAGWSYCAHCGAANGRACGFCESPLPPGARFCSRCGTDAQFSRGSKCEGCGKLISVTFAFCPHCGNPQGERCSRCVGRILGSWRWCPSCGQEVDPASIGTRPEPAQSNRGHAEEPGTAEEHNAEGRRLYETEEYASAIAHFQTAIEMEPRNPLYHCNLGVVFAELGHDDSALAQYNEAASIAPSDPTPYLNLGYFYSERNDPFEARKALDKVMEVAPGSPEAEEARQILDSLGEL